ICRMPGLQRLSVLGWFRFLWTRRISVVATRIAQLHRPGPRRLRRWRRRGVGLRLLLEVLIVVAEVANRMALADFEHLGHELIENERIVADYYNGTRKSPERVEQRVLRDDVEVVGRLVEQQATARPRQHPRHRHARAHLA